MASASATILALVSYACILIASTVSSSANTLTLHRVPRSTNISELVAHDIQRHHFLHSHPQLGAPITFPLGGNLNPNLLGLYYTRLQLGTPPRDYYVFIDTGSFISWVSCISCTSCPKSTQIQNISLSPYDPRNSQSASFVNCNDKRCKQVSGSKCSKENYRCQYDINYQDKSRTSGFLVRDILSFMRSPSPTIYNTPIIFGCATAQTADLMTPSRAVDGLFGFGRQRSSIVSQLASQGLIPWAFSHCLSGNGGGTLIFGVIVDPNIIYSSLVHSSNRYNLDLKFIAINNQRLPIPRSVFAKNRGATVDSGTTLSFLPSKAYNILISAVDFVVSTSSIQNFLYGDNHCYLVNSSVMGIFPRVSFIFEGGAAMTLDPVDYLIPQDTVFGGVIWCMGFIKSDGPTILGENFMKNKFFVYDLAGQRIGWTKYYDCDAAVNVTTVVNGTGRSDASRPMMHVNKYMFFSVIIAIGFLIIVD